jgi:hypothetical protein
MNDKGAVGQLLSDTIKRRIIHQVKKMPVMLLPGTFIMLVVGAITVYSGIVEGSIAVIIMGLFFICFAAWYFLTY